MRVETEEYLDFSQVLLKPKRSKLTSRSQADVTRYFSFLYAQNEMVVTPIIAANMDSVGTKKAAEVLAKHNMLCALHKFYTLEEYVSHFACKIESENSFYTIGTRPEDLDKYLSTVEKIGYFPNICVDIANGYSESYVDFIARLRDLVTYKCVIMAGNVATPEITEELIMNGADIVKAGIGSGAMCTTRSVTGVGVPQFSCVAECADAAHGVGGMLCSDGGITCPGDVVKAFGAGADFVMVGSEFAGHTENSGIMTYTDGELDDIKIYGMSSSTAQAKHYAGKKPYRSSEGRTANVKFRGYLQETIEYYLGGLRSGMTYIGADKIKEIPKRATFIKVSKILNETYSARTEGIR